MAEAPRRLTSEKGKLNQGRRPTKRPPMKVGRHSKLTPEISKKICDAIRAGNHLSVAARYSGVGELTLHSWLTRGRGEHPTRSASQEFVNFVNDVTEAQAAAEVAAVLHWRSAMPKDWHAAKDWLKVTQPERWDPDRDKIGLNAAMAGVQINIGSQGQGPSSTAPSITEMPLEHLIEDSPAFLKALMPLFDAVDAAYAQDEAQTTDYEPKRALMDENVHSGPELVQNGQNGADSAVDAVFDAEEGTWRVIEGQSDQEEPK